MKNQTSIIHNSESAEKLINTINVSTDDAFLASLPQQDNCYVISKRNKHSQNSDLSDLPRDENGRIIIQSRAERKKQLERPAPMHEPFYPFDEEENEIDWSSPSSPSPCISVEDDDHKSKKKKDKGKGKGKRKDKKKKKKSKKQKSRGADSLSADYLEKIKSQELKEKKPAISSVLGALAASREEIAVENGKILIYDKKLGYFKKLDKHEANIKISELLDCDERLQVNHRTVTDAVKSLSIMPEVQRTLSNSFNTPLINCKNGVLNIETNELLPHSSDYEFKEFINANYDTEAEGPVFNAFIKDACKGDKDLIRFVQEVMGYSLSSYIFLKKAFLFWGPPNTGKSLILKTISDIAGNDNVSHVDIQKLSEPCFLATLMDSKLNIVSDLPNTPIMDIGFFKSCVSGGVDIIMSRSLYNDPEKHPCTCKLLFGSNHFIPLKKLEANDIKAYFDRMLILPFTNEKSGREIDLTLSEKLSEEHDYIFSWSMKGLKRLIKNKWEFTQCKVSEDALHTYRTSYSPEAVFFSEYMIEDSESIVSTTEVEAAYRKFAASLDIDVKQHAMKTYIAANYPHIQSKRKRYKGSSNPIYVYAGLRLLEE